MKSRVSNTGTDRKRLAVTRDPVETGDFVDVDQMRRLGEAEGHDRNEALAAGQHPPVPRGHLGQNLDRLVERLRHMADEGRGLHGGFRRPRANYLYTNDKDRRRIVKRRLPSPRFGPGAYPVTLSLKRLPSYPICRSSKAPKKVGGMQTVRSIAVACLAAVVLAAAPAVAEQIKRPDKVSFYFAAHEDDWQLFMNPSAFQDVIKGASKTVFIHLTAGDAGLGIGMGGRKHPFYLARENGAEAAIRFMANADAAPAERLAAPMTFNGHPIYRVSYRNTVGYFLRVPDGHWTGDGYYETGYESLRRLSTGETDA